MCISKPFKGVLRNFWENYVANTVINLPETEQQREIFKIPSPSRQDIVNWIAEGINYLKSHPEMVNSLKRSWTQIERHKLKDKLADEEEELLEDEDPFSFV